MTIYNYSTQEGGKFWGVSSYLGINPQTGQQVNCYKQGFKTKSQAVKYLNQEKILFDSGVYKFKNKDYTFQELYDTWIDRYKLTVKNSTLKKTKGLFKNHILPFFHDVKIKNITPDDIEVIVDKWYRQFKDYRKVYVYLKKILDWAVFKKRWLKENPCQYAELPAVKYITDNNIVYYTKEELKTVLEALEKYAPYKWYVFFRILAYTGLRRGEALALTWEDIIFHNSQLVINKNLTEGTDGLYVSNPKTLSSVRTISIDSETIKVLRRWKLKQAQEFLQLGIRVRNHNQLIFTQTEKNEVINLTTPRNFFHKFCKKYKLKFLKIHGFRHTHCSLLFEAGVPMNDVKERLGHSDIKTTMNIYAHVTPDSRKKSADKFANFMNN
ncbi:site-specific integrase [Aerococcus sp. JJEM-2022b]|uniref:tyrosine-type recombinase/integrase n=1 Tax=Aerococcus mictus TaxID=2976810 RepID=UPI00227D059E|nr:site-specific integrase [Aerococcus mictus]MCY3078557.1 site-specific integrase [Aerococcus mictus]